MKRALPILGIAGLALLTVSAPALAGTDTDTDSKKVLVCHATSSAANPYVATFISVNALGSHRLETADIVPPNSVLKWGQNWTVAGQADYAKYCPTTPPAEEQPPVDEEPPGEEQPPVDEQPPVKEEPPVKEQPPAEQQPAVVPETPVTPTVPVTPVTLTPAAQTPAGQAAAPQGAVAKVPAAAVSRGTNQGFNAQTAVGGTEGGTTWLAGLGVLLGAGAVVSVRRKSRTESPTAG